MEYKSSSGIDLSQPNAPSNDNVDPQAPTVYEVKDLPDAFANKVKEIGVAGNYNAALMTIEKDLAPGEEIKRHIEVFVPRGKMTCYELFLCIVTCGIYYVLMLIHKFCGTRLLYADRCRIAITNTGRILRWKSDIHGVQNTCCFCLGGARQFISKAQISSFNIRKLTSIQRTYSKRQMLCGCVGTDHHFGSLLLVFDRYLPHSEFLFQNRLQGLGNLPSSVETETLRSTAGRWWDFAFARPAFASKHPKFVANPCDAAFADMCRGHLGRITSPLSQISTTFFDLFRTSLQAATGSWDTSSCQVLHLLVVGGGPTFQELIDFETHVLQWTPNLRHDCLVGDVQANLWDEQNGPGALLSDDKKPRVNVNRRYLNLPADEEVIDVFPIRPVWTCEQIVLTICTLSLYYWFVVTYIHRVKSALILTRKRLFEVHLNKKEAAQFDAFAPESPELESFELSVRQWHFGKLSQGYVEYNGDSCWGHFKTRFGGLRVFPTVAYSCCLTPLCFGLLPEDVADMRRFLMNFSGTPELHSIDTSRLDLQPVNENEFIASFVKLQPKEQKVFVLHGEDPWGCCHKVVRTLSCGTTPVKTFQQILITNTRLWAAAKAENEPWCWADNICLCGVKYEVVYWKPLMDVRGWRSTSNVSLMETCISRLFNFLPCCQEFVATQNVEIATTKGFPVIVQQLKEPEGLCGDAKQNYGLAYHKEILQFREVMALSLATAKAVKANPSNIKIEVLSTGPL